MVIKGLGGVRHGYFNIDRVDLNVLQGTELCFCCGDSPEGVLYMATINNITLRQTGKYFAQIAF